MIHREAPLAGHAVLPDHPLLPVDREHAVGLLPVDDERGRDALAREPLRRERARQGRVVTLSIRPDLLPGARHLRDHRVRTVGEEQVAVGQHLDAARVRHPA